MTCKRVIAWYWRLWSAASYLYCLLFSQISFSFWKYPAWHLHVFSEQMAFESPRRVQLLVPVHVEPRTEKQIGVHCITVLFCPKDLMEEDINFQYDNVHQLAIFLLILSNNFLTTMLNNWNAYQSVPKSKLAKQNTFTGHMEMAKINSNLLFWQSFWVVLW